MTTPIVDTIAELRRLLAAATPRAPHYAHPESEAAKATHALDVATRNALPALLDALEAATAEREAYGMRVATQAWHAGRDSYDGLPRGHRDAYCAQTVAAIIAACRGAP